MALTKQQKKELIEAGVVVAAAIALFSLFHRPGSGGDLLTPSSVDTTPNGFGSNGAGPASITYNYPAGEFPGDPGSAPAPQSPAISFGFGGSDFGGQNFGGSSDTIGGITTNSPITNGGIDTNSPFTFGGITGSTGDNNAGCGCCATTPPSGDALGSPTALQTVVTQRAPHTPQIVAENPYSFNVTPYGQPPIPANSVRLDNGETMSLTRYNQLVADTSDFTF